MMKRFRYVLIPTIAVALPGCVVVSTTTEKPQLTTPRLEAVYSASATKGGLAVRVSSNGCTKADDFAVSVERGGDVPVVTLTRTRQDPCRAFAIGGTVVVFDYAKVGVAGDFKLANPLTPWNGPGD